MQYVIPEIPSELKTQLQREALLAKEAKYEHGLKKGDYDYDEVLSTIRENNNTSRSDVRVGTASKTLSLQRQKILLIFFCFFLQCLQVSEDLGQED